MSGFAPDPGRKLKVEFEGVCMEKVPEDKLAALEGILAADPRPSYQNDPERVYALDFAELEVRFTVDGETLTVHKLEKRE